MKIIFYVYLPAEERIRYRIGHLAFPIIFCDDNVRDIASNRM